MGHNGPKGFLGVSDTKAVCPNNEATHWLNSSSSFHRWSMKRKRDAFAPSRQNNLNFLGDYEEEVASAEDEEDRHSDDSLENEHYNASDRLVNPNHRFALWQPIESFVCKKAKGNYDREVYVVHDVGCLFGGVIPMSPPCPPPPCRPVSRILDLSHLLGHANTLCKHRWRRSQNEGFFWWKCHIQKVPCLSCVPPHPLCWISLLKEFWASSHLVEQNLLEIGGGGKGFPPL